MLIHTGRGGVSTVELPKSQLLARLHEFTYRIHAQSNQSCQDVSMLRMIGDGQQFRVQEKRKATERSLCCESGSTKAELQWQSPYILQVRRKQTWALPDACEGVRHSKLSRNEAGGYVQSIHSSWPRIEGRETARKLQYSRSPRESRKVDSEAAAADVMSSASRSAVDPQQAHLLVEPEQRALCLDSPGPAA